MKKTLLIAAAALVAGIVSSNAQVYSANIVGYVNVAAPANTFTLMANPLDDGTNQANDLLGTIPNRATVELWSGTSFTSYTKTSSGFAVNPSIPVGTGFFVKATANFTNTFVGNVVPAPGGNQATNSLPANQFALVGSILPVSGNFNDSGTNALNLIATLPNRATVETWAGTSFTSYTKTSSGFAANPAYAPGTGFFVKGTAASLWVQTLQ
jgi:hypothetical protein